MIRHSPHTDYLGLEPLLSAISECPVRKAYGKVIRLLGNMIEARGIDVAVGDLCRISPKVGSHPIIAEVVGFQGYRIQLSPLSDVSGVGVGCLVSFYGKSDIIMLSSALLGRVIDAMGNPIDGGPPIRGEVSYPLYGLAPNPLERVAIREQLDVGIRCINGLLPIGKGQRVGIFAGSGVGKSTLLGMMARYTSAPVNVIALIGERGREVKEFLENNLGSDGLAHSVVVVATSDQAPLLRIRGAFLATTIAEYFRDQGTDVLLMMDSVTRFAMAAREVGLAAGEPPTTKGYTPSVFSKIPKLLERAGSFSRATITGIYTVLVEGNDMDDPIADSMRSILDGHIILDRNLAHNRHYPPIDVLGSVSRLMANLFDDRQRALATRFVKVLAHYKKNEDLIQVGAYAPGSNPETDYAIKMIDRLNSYLQQKVEEKVSIKESLEALEVLFES